MEQEKLVKINKTSNLIGIPFRIVSDKGQERLKTNYDFWIKHKNNHIFREHEGSFQRYDKQTKQWVEDNQASYWYTDEKTKKRKSFISVGTEFIIEFEAPTNIEVWSGQLMSKKVTKCLVEFTGNMSFGQTKQLFDRLTEFEAMGKERTKVFVTMYKDGLKYNFKYHSDFSQNSNEIRTEQPKQNVVLTPSLTPSVSLNLEKAKDSINALKNDEYKHYTKTEIRSILTEPRNGINLTLDEANAVIIEHFNERGE